MTLKFYYHPLSSFCWKVLIALHENTTPFEPVLVKLYEEDSRDAFLKVWPMGKLPAMRDEARDHLVPESSIIVEYLDRHYPGAVKLLPADPDRARRTRMADRFLDLYIETPLQKIVGDRLRPSDKKDAFGVEEARALMRKGLSMVEEAVGPAWMMGEDFTLADCSAAPALFYAAKIMPLGTKTSSYLERLKARPSFARTLKDAEPYLAMFPSEDRT